MNNVIIKKYILIEYDQQMTNYESMSILHCIHAKSVKQGLVCIQLNNSIFH